ncbi:hypothetical protein MJD09_18425, partial [bacterium]|nr:hypothetical protein [bacterium]
MNRAKTLFMAVLFVWLPLSQSNTHHSREYQLLWSDEFDGVELDLAKWEYMVGDGTAYGIPGWGNNELEFYKQ